MTNSSPPSSPIVRFSPKMPPSSRLHPSQIRSSCERCRRHKLRCTRTPPTAATCTTCHRLGYECVSGQQRKVGRPAKRSRDVVAVRKSPSPELVNPQLGLGATEDMLFVPQPDTQDFGWMLEESMNLFPSASFDQALASFNDGSIVPELLMPGKEDYLTIRTPDFHFSALSKLNCRLNAAANVFDKASANGISLDGLVIGMCIDEGHMVTPLGKHGLKVLMETAQEFLKAIRAIHRKVGINVRPSTSETPFTSPYSNLNLPKIDSPTAFLIISCFVQILNILELVYTVVTTRFRGPSGISSEEVIPTTISFADVNLLDFTSQLAVFSELSRHLLMQMMLVLGLPGVSWSGGTTWTGLLQDGKYRDMLNGELGSVEGDWSRRPADVLAMMNAARDMIFVQSMADYV